MKMSMGIGRGKRVNYHLQSVAVVFSNGQYVVTKLPGQLTSARCAQIDQVI